MNFVNKLLKICTFIFAFVIIANLVYAESSVINNISKGPVAYGSNAYEPLSLQIIDKPLGSRVLFGHYEQDGNIENGKEPVEWILIDVDHNDNSATLIAVYLLDCLRFDGFSRYITWDNSSLRNYMNSTMLNDMFDADEQLCIKKSVLANLPNPFYENEPSGLPTEDYLYIPAIEDMVLYFSNHNFVGEALFQELLRPNEKRMAIATPYAQARGLRTTGSNHEFPYRGNYFLRTIGKTGHRRWYGDVYADYYQSYITELGELKPEGTGVDSIDDGIRPMVKVYF